jgi:probable blue pigment (indigoidine) exporter
MGVLAVVWGLNYLFVREGLTLSAPLWLAALRSGVGALALVPLVLSQVRRSELSRVDVRDALAIGVPNTAMFFGLWFLAARSIPPGETAVLVYTFPLFVTLVAIPVLGTRPDRIQTLAVVLGFGGVVLVSQPWLGGADALAPLPVAALLLAALSWAFGTVLFKRRFSGSKVVPANALQLLGGTGGLLLAATLTEGSSLPTLGLPLVATVAWLGVLGTAVAYSIWFALLDRRPAGTLSAYTFLVPLVALAASAVVFGEQVNAVEAGGVGVVLAALYLNGRGAAPRAPAEQPPVSSQGSPGSVTWDIPAGPQRIGLPDRHDPRALHPPR